MPSWCVLLTVLSGSQVGVSQGVDWNCSCNHKSRSEAFFQEEQQTQEKLERYKCPLVTSKDRTWKQTQAGETLLHLLPLKAARHSRERAQRRLEATHAAHR